MSSSPHTEIRRSCVVCKNSYNSNFEGNWFPFPNDERLRLLWMKHCKVRMIIDDPEDQWGVCYMHFTKDKYVDINGYRCLTKGAVPLSTLTINPGVIEVTPKRTSTEARKHFEVLTRFDYNSEILLRISMPDEPLLELESTLLPNNTMVHNKLVLKSKIQPTSCLLSKELKKTRTRRVLPWYVGQLKETDFDTPEKRQANLALVKNKMEKFKHKIRSLQQQKRRMVTYMERKTHVHTKTSKTAECQDEDEDFVWEDSQDETA